MEEARQEEGKRKQEEEKRKQEDEDARARVKEYQDAVEAAAHAKEVFWTRMKQGQNKGT